MIEVKEAMKMNNGKKIVHVFVAPSSWNSDLIYRRHRLAVFLHKQKNTEQVIWIAPKVSSQPKSILSMPEIKQLENGMLEIIVSDYKSLIKHIGFLQKKLNDILDKTEKSNHTFYLWYTYPAFSSLINMNIWDQVVYDCSDLWKESEETGNAVLTKVKQHLILQTEKKIVHAANQCFASSKHLYHHITSLGKKNVELVENGVDYDSFQEAGKDKKEFPGNRPLLGFVGGLKPWKIDFSLLIEVAKKKREWDILLIGETYGDMPSNYKELIEQPNVYRYESVPYTEIPSYMKLFDIGLLPYLDNDYNKGVFPLKFYEYLASGLPVVGCGLPSTEHCVADDVYEHVENEAQDFIDACKRVIDCENPFMQERRLEAAKEADWNTKLEYMWKQTKSFHPK
jgi:teichuronic acid biosynthesis glycosyltransferase TuaH